MTPDDHKIVQLARATADEIDQYVGFDGELTADTSNYWLRLHDGVTPGGHKIPNLDALSELFQARSNELDGLLGFKDQDKGFLARLGPATYRLRTLTVNDQELKISLANGYGGNPLVELADDITSDQHFSGVVTFTQQIIGAGGFKGDVEGNLVGDVTGDVLGNVTGNLTGDSNGHHTGSQTGDVDVRGHTLQLDAGQIHLAALNQDVLDHITQESCPVGAILMWSGTLATIPEFFALCDGANGTPDLRDKFVIGAGLDYDVADTGGSTTSLADITLTEAGAHTHTVDVESHVLTVAEMPSHQHGAGVCDNHSTFMNHGSKPANPPASTGIDNNHSGPLEALTDFVGGGQGHTHNGSTESAGNHTHTVEVGDQPILPPYFALAFIQKVA